MHKSKLGIILALTMIFSMVLSPAAYAGLEPASTHADSGPSQLQPTLPAPDDAKQAKPTVIGETDRSGTEIARYIVVLEAEPLALYKGGVAGLTATNPSTAGTDRLAMRTSAAEAYLGFLSLEQANALSSISATIDRAPTVVFDYKVTLNGFTLELSPQEAAEVAKQDGIKRVYRDFERELHTDYGPEWIGAPSIWDGSATMDSTGTKGEGIVVGIIDTGINMDNPSFAATGDDGYTHTNPRGKFYGACDPDSDQYDATLVCNDKLIGAWNFLSADVSDSPEDDDGHGSHTASTAAGNVVDPAVLVMPTYTYSPAISGVAPHANIISYKSCCQGSALLAGIEQATIDQVDVINYSIGSASPSDPWLSPDEIAFLAATEAGVTVATSAGNDGPGFATLGSPSGAPWLMTVAASTHNRKFASSLIDMTGGDTEAPGDIDGKSISGGYGPAPIVYAGDYGDDALCAEPFAADTFDGQIVVCDRGEAGRVEKGENVLAGGAGGYILANDEANGASLSADGHVLPAVHITYADGQVLEAWLASGADHMATITETSIEVDDANGDIMAGFSSRGPSRSALDILKPDITGPGVDIIAAYKDPEDFNSLSGTSMSSPHLAGAAALVKAAQPDWTPAEIKSALMLTSKSEGILKEDGVTPSDPFDRGAGRVDLSKAALAGFVLDETTDNFLTADPSFGGDPTTLNLASLGKANCIGECSWTRVLSSTLDVDVAWEVAVTAPISIPITVEPANFTLAAGGVQTVTVTADVSGAAVDEWYFGQIDFTPDSDAAVSAHFPVAVYVSNGNLPETTIRTRRNQGAYTIEDVVTASIDELEAVIYSAPAETSQVEIAEDPTNDDPYDLDSGGVIYTLRTIEADDKIFGAATYDSSAPDLDLYVGLDTNGNGEPDADEELCFSATGSANESCVLTAPMEAGEYWILVQNWEGSGAETDTFTLAISIANESDTSLMTVSAPASAESSVPFELTVNWNVPGMNAGDSVLGLLELTDKSNADIGISNTVTLQRIADDVIFSADKEAAKQGDTITYAIDVLPETSIPGDAVNYSFEVSLPDGVQYIEGTASMTPTSVSGNVVSWEDVDISTLRDYVVTDSTNDPLCDTGYGGYLNLADFGLTANPTISGTGFLGATGFSGIYYGEEYGALSITADGFLTVNEDVGDTPGLNTALPDPALPNGVIAPFWRDLEVVYDGETNRGVTLASDGDGFWYIIEYDGIEPEPAGSTEDRYDFQVIMAQEAIDTPGSYEIVMAYDNITGTLSTGTIGVENADGTRGQTYAYNDAVIEDGLMVCHDWLFSSTTMTFQAVVDGGEGGLTTTTLENTVNEDGFGTDTDTVQIQISPTAIDDEDPVRLPDEDSFIFLPVILGQ